MKKNKKKKINKFSIRRILAIVIIVVAIILLRLIVQKYKNRIPDLSILYKNELIETEKEVLIDEKKNIYFSKEDIQNLFDEMIYYNDAEKELITANNKHVALLKLNEQTMLVNDQMVNLSGIFQEKNGIKYMPLRDLQRVYDIEVQYIEKTNRIIIDSVVKEKKQATLSKNTKLKNKKFLLSKSVAELKNGENVIIIEKGNTYSKVRNSAGVLGFVKSKRLINEQVLREEEKELKFNLNVYDEYSNISGIYENLEVEEEKLNVVIPTFFYLGKNSKILDKTTSTTATYANYTNWLKENKLEMLPTLENTENVSNTLLTYNQRSQAINELCSKLTYYQYKGINIDFKNIDDLNSFYRFIIELAPRCKEVGLILCVTINDNMDKEKILKITDYIIDD